jgi:hypothetical protein
VNNPVVVVFEADGGKLGGLEGSPAGKHGQGGVVEVDAAAGGAGLATGLMEFVADGDETLVDGQPALVEVDVVPLESEDLVAAHPGHRRHPQQREEPMTGGGTQELAELHVGQDRASVLAIAFSLGERAKRATLRVSSPRRTASLREPRTTRWIS